MNFIKIKYSLKKEQKTVDKTNVWPVNMDSEERLLHIGYFGHFSNFFMFDDALSLGKQTVTLYHVYHYGFVTAKRIKAYEYDAIDLIPHGISKAYDKFGFVTKTIYFHGKNLHIDPDTISKKAFLYLMLSGRLPEGNI